jgi:GxxExxY protein
VAEPKSGTAELREMNSNHTNTSSIIVEKELSHAIVGSFLNVYNKLGYGFVETIYARALEITMRERGLRVDREYPIPVIFDGQQIGFHRVDIFVERRIIVELKSTERLAAIARRQLRSYVTAGRLDLGILLHFGPVPRFYRELGRHRP